MHKPQTRHTNKEAGPFADWKANAPRLYPKNQVFLHRLSRQKLDLNALQEVHEEVFSRVDCLVCGNCCKTVYPIFTKTDVSRISDYLGMKAGAFETQYLKADASGDLVANQLPCPFLNSDNTCGVYEVRPKSCRSYPHTDLKEGWQRPDLLARNTVTCPAAFAIVQRMKDKLA